MPTLRPLYVGCLSCYLTLGAAFSREPNWDPPAIQDFPIHEDFTASGKKDISIIIEAGERLFRAQFNVSDGAGRPTSTGNSKPTIRRGTNVQFSRLAGPDANSCAGCHNQPSTGGAGDFATNVFVGAHMTDPPTSLARSSITNERNTTSLFGLGVIEMLAREMTRELLQIKNGALAAARDQGVDVDVPLVAKGIDFGRLLVRPDGTIDAENIKGLDVDLVVKPFGAKGVAASLREFTNFALNQHHGIQTVERFGWARTGIIDFDGDGIIDEFTVGQVSALTLFQASLPPPCRLDRDKPDISQGESFFSKIGCGECHIPSLPLSSPLFSEPNEFNRPGSARPDDLGGVVIFPFRPAPNSGLNKDEKGALIVSAYTDFKRHTICDEGDRYYCNEEVQQDFVPVNEFMTPRLWDIGSTAPYGHRGDLTTLSQAIIHHAGEARVARDRFMSLSDEGKKSIVNFLLSLRVCTPPL